MDYGKNLISIIIEKLCLKADSNAKTYWIIEYPENKILHDKQISFFYFKGNCEHALLQIRRYFLQKDNSNDIIQKVLEFGLAKTLQTIIWEAKNLEEAYEKIVFTIVNYFLSNHHNNVLFLLKPVKECDFNKNSKL